MDQPMNKPMLRDEKGRLLPGGPGRPVGAVDKITKTVKETVLAVFNDLQTDPQTSLTAFAIKYPRDFYNIAAKLIPTDITADIKATVDLNQITGMVIKQTDDPEL